MARLYSFGAELNSTTMGMEYTSSISTPTIDGTAARSGSYGMHISSLASGTAKGFRHSFLSAAGNGPYWFRQYFNFASFPGAENRIFLLNDAEALTTPVVYLTVDNSGVLKLYDEDGQITGTTTLSTGTPYCIEVKFDATAAAGSHVVEARVDEAAAFATASNRSLSAGVWVAAWGGNLASEANTTGEWYIDDVAINNNTGSFENTYPGKGELITLRPSGAGDYTTWARGGTDSGANWSQVSDVTPDDATAYILENTNNADPTLCSDDFALTDTPAALASNDVIHCVQVGVRFALDSATGSDPRFVLRIKASALGTVEESAVLTYNSTVWVSYSHTTPKNPFLTLYDLPGASTTAWTKADLDSAQIGVRLSVTDTDNVLVSSLWLYVDHEPAGSAPQTVNLSAAAVTAGGQALTVTPGAVSTSLTAAALASSGPQLAVTPGAVSLAMSVATLIAGGQTISITPGAVSTALLAAVLAAQGQTITIDAGGPVQVNLSAAVLSALGQAITLAPGEVSISLSAATLSALGQILGVSPGAASVLLSAAGLAAGGQTISVQPGEVSTNLASALLVSNGQTITIQPGAVSIALANALSSAAGQTITISAPGGLQVDLNAASLAALGQTIGITPGAVSLALLAASVSANGQMITVQISTDILLNAAALSALGQAITLAPGEVSISLSAATLSALGQVLGVSPGAASVLLSAADLIASGQAITLIPEAVSVSLLAAALSANGQSITVSTFIEILTFGIVHGPDYVGNLQGPGAGFVRGPHYVGEHKD